MVTLENPECDIYIDKSLHTDSKTINVFHNLNPQSIMVETK